MSTTARSYVSRVLVVVASLLLVASTVAVWGQRTVFDTDRFMNVVGPALDDPAFYQSLSRNISDQVIDVLDLEARVTARLAQLDEFIAEELVNALDLRDSVRAALALVDRPTLAGLAPSIVDPLEARIRERIATVITSERVTETLPLLVRRAHEVSVAFIDGDLAELPNVYVADDEVRINLIPVIVDALEPVIELLQGYLPDVQLPTVVSLRVADARAELGDALGAQLPEDFGQLTVMSGSTLAGVQDVASRINTLVWLLVIATLVLLAASVIVAPDRRRTIIWLSLGVTVALAVAWVIVGRIREAVLDTITEPDSRAAIGALVAQTVASFRTYVLVVLAAAVIAGMTAIGIAHRDALDRARRWVHVQLTEPTPFNRAVSVRADALRMVGFVVAALVLVIVGIDVVAFVVTAALLGAYLLAIGVMRVRWGDEDPRRPAGP